jgi:chemotaxis protein histidine kinase CheA
VAGRKPGRDAGRFAGRLPHGGRPGLAYEGTFVPLLNAQEVFGVRSSSPQSDSPCLMLLKKHDQQAFILIDEILHYAVLPILPLHPIFSGVRRYLGVTHYGHEFIIVFNFEQEVSETGNHESL